MVVACRVWQVVTIAILLLTFGKLAAAENPRKIAVAVHAVLAAPAERIDFVQAKLALDRLIDPSIDTKAVTLELDRLAAEAARLAGPQATALQKIAAIRRVIYEPRPWNGSKPFRYDQRDPLGAHIANKLLSTYLRTRLGNCVSMPILFLILADRLGVEATLSTAPLHVFVKVTDDAGRVRNLETTDGAQAMREDWYRQKLAISDKALASGIYMARLSRQETVALMANTVVVHLIAQERYAEAAEVADVILRHYPRDIHTLLAQGTAYAHLLDGEFYGKYPGPNAIPPELRSRYAMLVEQNRKAFETAEALGWTATP